MARLRNDTNFELEPLLEQQVAEFVGATESSCDERIEMLFLRVVGDNDWHRMFLDAGIGFWEKWTRDDAFTDFDGLRIIDFADRWNLVDSKIISAMCHGGTLNDSVFSHFILTMDAGTLKFAFSDDTDMESDTIVSFEPSL